MAQITIGRSNVLHLRTFVTQYNVSWFVAKDQGAYVGAVKSATNRVLFYFEGCNPESKFDEWYSNCVELFGGDDFGEVLPREWLDHVANDRSIVSMTISVEPENITAEFNRR